MARPQYRNLKIKQIFADVSEETKAMLEDISYVMDQPMRIALDRIIREYYKREKIKPRPSRVEK